jgi:formylglycine-generating enzyme required for sulfatase activity
MTRPAGQPSFIFICYRRDDAAGYAGHLFESLAAHFGREQIFMDIEQLELGEDFAVAIETAVGACEVLIVLIGPDWLVDRNNVRRLDDPEDFVRLEIATALRREIRVIPVLVPGAKMPKAEDLPPELSPLSRRQALDLSQRHWRHDIDHLIGVIEKIFEKQRAERESAAQPGGGIEPPAAGAVQVTEPAEPPAQTKAGAGRVRETEAAVEPAPQVGEGERRPAAAAATPTAGREAPHGAAAGAGAVAPVVRRRPGEFMRSNVAKNIFAVAAVASVGVIMWWLLRPAWIWVWQDGPAGGATPEAAGRKVEGGGGVGKTPPEAPPGMVYVEGGEFLMGNDAAGDVAEKPAHKVQVKPFFIDRYEVTNEDYAQFSRGGARARPATWKGGSYPRGEGRRPVTGLDWDAARTYCEEAVGKRLPTEEEWEFAARGTDGRLYPWGNTWQDGLANARVAERGLVDVGTYKGVTPFGAFDMVGNAWEWTASDMRAYPGGQLPDGLPGGPLKVIRGGTYNSSRDAATSTYRTGWPVRGAQTYAQTGFRCARDAASQ